MLRRSLRKIEVVQTLCIRHRHRGTDDLVTKQQFERRRVTGFHQGEETRGVILTTPDDKSKCRTEPMARPDGKAIRPPTQ